jgi:hypothetical protein
MCRDVVAVCLLQDAPVLEAPIESFMARPCGALHLKIFSRVAIIVGAFYLIGVPHVAVVGFHSFARLEAVRQDVIEDLEVRPRAGEVGFFDPDQVSGKDVNAQLAVQGGLSEALVGAKKVPLLCDPLLLDAEVGSVYCD